ncbi:MAG: hypothetical protein OEQ74_06820 [Gammaproteobacteria bacterium]|nr:hypothetical protein [Gammaproteobacteria bacterium]
MSRTLGFFLGSAAVFAMLVYILGQPVPLAVPADRQKEAADQSAFVRSAVVPVPARRSEPEQQPSLPQTDAPAEAAPVQPLPADSGPPPATLEATPEAAPTPDQTNEVELVETWLANAPDEGPAEEVVAVESAQSMGPPRPTVEMEWFMVWDPFHSELSANAFARRLERITGLDYRVIKTDPARYRVAVGYTSEEQRVANVAAIEEATGLSIAGGSR